MELVESLLETWAIHNRITLFLLESVAPEALAGVAASKGRSVGEQFAHLHNVRLMWLAASAPALIEGMKKIDKGEAQEKQVLAESLQASSQAMAILLEETLRSGGRIRGFKPHAAGFLGYLIAHEAHHRGQITLTLKQTGYPVDKKVMYGLWEWGVR